MKTDRIDRSRQYDLFRPEQASPVTVIGVGGVGSALAIALAKMGVPELAVYDFDVVGDENLASQWYRARDIGRPKAEAIAEAAREYASADIDARGERYEDQPLRGAVIAAVDSMDMRLRIWEQVKLNPDVELFVDARMGGLIGLVLAARPCDPDDIRFYESRLYASSEAASDPCTSRAIVFNTMALGAWIAGTLRRWWVRGDVVPIRTLDLDGMTVL